MNQRNILIGIGLLCATLSCNPLRHYNAVAKDTPRSEEKRAILAPVCAVEFPNKQSKDSSTVSKEEQRQGTAPVLDTATKKALEKACPELDIDSLIATLPVRTDTVTKTSKTTVRIKETDSAAIKTAQDIAYRIGQENVKLSQALQNVTAERDVLNAGKRNVGTLLLWLWQIIRWWLLAACIIYLVIKTKNIWLTLFQKVFRS